MHFPMNSSSRPSRTVSTLGLALALVLAGLSTSGCSLVINKIGNSLAGGNSVFATDDDPDLVWEAVPFGLKTMESLLGQAPRNKNLLLAACSGFTQYGYGHLQADADYLEATNFDQAAILRDRAKKMYVRALDYGLRGLEVDFPGFRQQLRKDPKAAAAKLQKKHVPMMYWTGLAWGAAISIAKNDAELSADQNQAEALMRRALELDETYELGSIHDFFIAYEAGRAGLGGSYEESKKHYERARQLSRGIRVSPLVSFAESYYLPQQGVKGFDVTKGKKEFQALLEEALAIDVNKAPEWRVANLVAQKRAKWLLGRMDELFVE